jgi:phytoene desaturase
VSRRISGPSDRVVVVGAGLSGLSAALHLAGRGRSVTVLERAATPGGRAGRRDVGGYRLDTGPTVLTMPDLVADALNAVGEDLSDRLDLVRLDPAYRAEFADGSHLLVHTDAEAMAANVAEFAGPAEAAGYRKLRSWLTALYRAEFGRFIAANTDSPLSLVSGDLARLAALGGFGRLDRAIGRFVTDERLRRVFSFQSLYAGQAPHRALALYGVIAYMDTVAGVWFPRGGMRALPDALAAAATGAGVDIRFGATVTALERRGDRVVAVRTEDERFSCDAVVLTTELPQSYALLGRTPRRAVPLRAAPSAVVAHLGLRRAEPDPTHHTILFGRAWRQTFTEIIQRGEVMSDPSLLFTRPTATDRSLAPPGRDLGFLLAPAPNLARGRIDWAERGPEYVAGLLDVLGHRLPGVGEVELLHVDTPADWARQGLVAGTPFAYAHTVTQTGPFRPGNRPGGVANAVLAGGSTVPGVGVPTAVVSGRLAADRITGTPVRSRPAVAR